MLACTLTSGVLRAGATAMTPTILRSRVLRPFAAAFCVGVIAASCDGGPSTPSDADIGSIEVTPSTLSLTAGTTRSLTARVVGPSGEPLGGVPVFWSTQNPNVAIVSEAGIVTAVAPGETQIAASKGGKSTIVPVTVVGLPVGLVRVSPTTATVFVGASASLDAEVFDAGGGVVTGRQVTWASANSSIATVSESGVVIGMSAGTVAITATASGVSGTAVITVRPVPVASVDVSPATGSVFIGQSVQLSATANDSSGNTLAGRTITWKSSAPSTASVSSTGLVTGLFPGTVTITASSEGKDGTAQVTVTLIPLGSIQIIPSSATIAVGRTAGLVAQLLDSAGAPLAGRTVAWSSNAPQFATVASDGIVTAVAAGQARITATAEGKSATATVDVTPVPVASVSVAPTSASIAAGHTQQFTATAKDAQGNTLTGRVVSWLSGAPSVATINQTGLATAIGVGSAVIIANSEGQQATVTLDVTPVTVGSVQVTPANGTLQVGNTLQLVAVVSDGGGTPLPGKVPSWTSSAASVATVTSGGLVTAVGTGSATITATSDGVTGASAILVSPVPVSNVTVTPSTGSLAVGGSLSLQVTLTDAGGNALSSAGRTIAYTSDAPTVASVSTSGLVTALSAGSANITVMCETVSAASSIAVTAPTVASVDVTPATASIAAGATVQLTAVAKDGSGATIPGMTVAWSTSNGSVATVNSAGLVTAGAGAGSAQITATVGSVFGVSDITVSASSSVASVVVAPTNSTLRVGQRVALTATPRDATGNPVANPSVTWSVNSGKATLSGTSGTAIDATAMDSGVVTVTASSAGQAGTSLFTISLVPVNSVTSVPLSLLPTIILQARSGNATRRTFRVQAADGSRLAGRAFSTTSGDANLLTAAPHGNMITNQSGEAEFDVVMTNNARTGMLLNVVISVEGKTLTWLVIGT